MPIATAHDIEFMRRAVIRAHCAVTPLRLVETTARYTDDEYHDRRHPDVVAQRGIEMRRASTRVKAWETRPKKKSSMPLPPWAFDDARLVQAIAGIAPAHQHWLRYAYADSREWDDEAGAVRQLWAAFLPTFGRAQGKTLKRAQGLAHLAVQDYRHRCNSGRVRHQPGEVRELLGVKESNWDVHWRPRWKRMMSIMERLDKEALAALWEVTDVLE
ncbi:MAG: bacteriophage antitermination protein Q [Pseudomonadota bacterium]|nr:bacteriophage antitermination protein Q [Pseudomonadota bacterium]